MTTGPKRRPTMYARRVTEDFRTQETPFSEAEPQWFTSDESWDRFALNPVINGEQMRTLIDPVEHLEHVTHSIDVSGYNHSMNQMWEEKEEEARTPGDTPHYVHGAGVYDWMKQGIRQRSPIEIHVNPGEEGYGQGEGHHRVVAAAAIQQETGEPRPVKFTASQGYMGASGGTRYSDDWGEDEYEPTPVPSSQRTTGRKMTPSNQPKLEARTSRNEAFTWNPHNPDPRVPWRRS